MCIEADSDDDDDDDDDGGSSEEKVLTVIGLRESCSITEEAILETLNLSRSLYRCSTRTVKCVFRVQSDFKHKKMQVGDRTMNSFLENDN